MSDILVLCKVNFTNNILIKLGENSTVKDLKETAAIKLGVAPSNIRWIFGSSEYNDNIPLKQFNLGLASMSVILTN